MSGYTRQSSAVIINGGTINASDSNNEFNALQTAFDATSGHGHDASSGSGPKIVLTTSVSGTLPVANGGTGAATFTANGVLLGNTTSAIAVTAAGTADQVLRIPHAGGAPAFGTIDISKTAAVTGTLAVTNGGTGAASFTDGQLLIGNSSGNTLAAATLTAGTSISVTNGASSITIAVTGLVIGTNVQAWDADLDALAALSSTGYIKRTGTATYSVGTAISLTADVSGILPSANGGTGMAFFTVAGPAASAKTFTFPNASATVLTDNALVTAAQGGTANGFFAVAGPASTTKTFTFPNASSTVLTDNAAVTVAQGGTGLGTLTAHNLIAGNGTSTPNFIAPSSTGKILISNGTDWAASNIADAANGGITVTNAATVTLALNPNDLTAKASPATSDSVVINDVAGGNVAKKSTISSVLALAAFSQVFTSAAQTISSGGTLTLAHSLTTTPTLFQARIKCTDAGGEAGYSQNDELVVETHSWSDAANSGHGMAIVPDATNLNVTLASGGSVFRVANKSSGTSTQLTNSKWSLTIRAWA